ncbi:hypothetical protein, partial [Actinocorallia lasiicapitis]
MTMVRLTGLLVLGLVLAPASAADARPHLPALTVNVDDARGSAKAGDTLTYRVVVDSAEPADFPATVELRLPAGVSDVTTSRRGQVSGTTVRWRTKVRPSGLTLLVATATLPAELTGDAVTATACVSSPGSPAPIVCSGDIDAVPARSLRPLWTATALAAALTLTCGAALVLWRRRRRP